MAVKQFKAESKKLLDLMINSIYTNKEIFLRELISNASDAIDKLYFRSLTDQTVGMNKDDFCIRLDVDKENRILTISDNGIGMSWRRTWAPLPAAAAWISRPRTSLRRTLTSSASSALASTPPSWCPAM